MGRRKPVPPPLCHPGYACLVYPYPKWGYCKNVTREERAMLAKVGMARERGHKKRAEH
nr:hypothetical protein [Mitsuokella multacida]